MTTTPRIPRPPEPEAVSPDLKAIRRNAEEVGRFGTGYPYIEASQILALLDYTETLIAALREARPLMIKPSDTGRHRKAVAARIDALLPPEPQR